MPTHTFIADDANSAVQRIRAELGPSAVVRSVRKLPRTGISRLLKQEQIEVVATVDEASPVEPQSPFETLQDEVRALKQQFAAMRNARNQPSSDWLGQCLADRNLLPIFREAIAANLPPGASEQHVDNYLRNAWKSEPELIHSAVHLFVGAPGSGKTTVLCKMLAQTCLVEQQPATIYQLDSHLANTSCQAAIFSEIVGAQCERTLPLAFERREESVFIDLPGVAVGDSKGLQLLHSIIESFGVPEIHLVLNAAYETIHLLEQVRFFSEIGISDLIVTHLDEVAHWGKVWNLVLGTNFAVRYLSEGQNVPGGLHQAKPDLLFQDHFCEK